MLLRTLLFFLVAFTAISNVHATNKDQVADIAVRLYRAADKSFISKRLGGPERGIRVVFVHKGKRYTVDHNYYMEGLQVWVRPNGTSRQEVVEAFADANMDGVVDFGTDGRVRIFATANQFGSGPAEGVEYKPYWQKRYDETLNALRAILK